MTSRIKAFENEQAALLIEDVQDARELIADLITLQSRIKNTARTLAALLIEERGDEPFVKKQVRRFEEPLAGTAWVWDGIEQGMRNAIDALNILYDETGNRRT